MSVGVGGGEGEGGEEGEGSRGVWGSVCVCDAALACTTMIQLQRLVDTLTQGPHLPQTQTQQTTQQPAVQEASVFVYVPDATHAADTDYPICQTYIDAVVQGCVEVGGQR